MAKTSRNAPCPCGSGRKYKNCCLGLDKEARSAQAVTRTGAPAASRPSFPADPVAGMRPYALARTIENHPEWRSIQKRDPKQWAMRTVEGVAGLTTEQIQQRLAEIGIDACRDAFLAAAAGEISAWAISDGWLEGRPESELPRFAEDFAGMAASELWKRFCPERPSLEMVDDWILEGYRHDQARRAVDAANLWWKAWQALRCHFTPAMRTATQADAVFRGMHLIFNWTQDLLTALVNASIDDRSHARIGIRYVQELLEQFPDEDDVYRTNAQADLGDLLYRAGRAAEGEQVLRGLVEEYPDRGIGYCRLSDELRSSDPRRALALLEEARHRPVHDAEYWDLDLRLEDVREKLKALQGCAG